MRTVSSSSSAAWKQVVMLWIGKRAEVGELGKDACPLGVDCVGKAPVAGKDTIVHVATTTFTTTPPSGAVRAA
jgi:hypothetical protein